MSKKDDFFPQQVPNFSLEGICGLCGLLHMSMDGLGIQVENSTRPPTSSKVGAHGGGNSVAERPGGGTPRPSGAAEPTDAFGDDGLTAASVPKGCAL